MSLKLDLYRIGRVIQDPVCCRDVFGGFGKNRPLLRVAGLVRLTQPEKKEFLS